MCLLGVNTKKYAKNILHPFSRISENIKYVHLSGTEILEKISKFKKLIQFCATCVQINYNQNILALVSYEYFWTVNIVVVHQAHDIHCPRPKTRFFGIFCKISK